MRRLVVCLHIGAGQEPAIQADAHHGSHMLASEYKLVRDATQEPEGDVLALVCVKEARVQKEYCSQFAASASQAAE